ncbi:MAG: ABC transporter substrate-binding protein [Nitrospira sp.]|nr:ABC transporter substrate-binding protein [Nitrospira sp.]
MTRAQTTVLDADGKPVVIQDTSRVVALGGAAIKLPKIGYQRTLSAEGVLSLKPSLILATTEAGPPAAITQLKGSGVPILILPAEYSLEGVKTKIRGVAKALGLETRGEELVRFVDLDFAKARHQVALMTSRPPKVMFIYARGQGTVLVSGTATAADEMIKLAGGSMR